MKNVKNALKIFFFATLCFFGYADMSIAGQERNSLEGWSGVYLGFFPTDESAIGIGEIEISIDEEVKFRMATGLEIREEKIAAAEFFPMTSHEIEEEFEAGSGYPKRVVGFRTETGFPKFLFLKDPKEGEEFGLKVLVGNDPDDLFSSSLFNPEQIARGDYEKTIRNIEEEFGEEGVIPRLRNGGKAEGNSENQ